VRHAADAIRTTVAEADLQAELLTNLGAFSRLAYPSMKLFELIGREPMKESTFIRELFAEEFEELRYTSQRTAITEVLAARFGEGTGETLSPLLAGITDRNRLSSLLRLAVNCASPEEFEKAVHEG
jgi:hypothetical protein